MNSIAIENCSQAASEYSAIRFEGATQGRTTLTNIVVVNSYGWALSITNSYFTTIMSSSFIGATSIGIRIDYASDISLSNVFTGDVRSVNKGESNSLTKEACVAFCSYQSSFYGSACSRVSITDSTAAGCPFAGFIAPGYQCELLDSLKFSYNVAHSVDGVGAYMYPDPTDATQTSCMEASYFFGYKNSGACLATFALTKELRVHDLSCIDN